MVKEGISGALKGKSTYEEISSEAAKGNIPLMNAHRGANKQ
jgi:hypothetical protein